MQTPPPEAPRPGIDQAAPPPFQAIGDVLARVLADIQRRAGL